jgi:hypothetical protein
MRKRKTDVASLQELQMVSLRIMVKPASWMKNRYVQSRNLPGLKGVTREESLARNLGDPQGPSTRGGCERLRGRATNLAMENRWWKYITIVWPERESEEPIVAMKWGNCHGAKGLYYKTRFKLMEQTDWKLLRIRG